MDSAHLNKDNRRAVTADASDEQTPQIQNAHDRARLGHFLTVQDSERILFANQDLRAQR
jgi:hypothetical protein